MRYVVTAKQSRKADEETVKLGTSSLTLMENTGVEAYNRIRKETRKGEKILVLCGKGGNGGDGYVIARLLQDSGYRHVFVYRLGAPVHPDAKVNAKAYKGKFVDKIDRKYDVYIDCLYGTGLKTAMPEKAREIVDKVNSLPGKKVSIDMPSGVDATTGEVHGVAFKCDLLLTVQFLKSGLFLNEAHKYFRKVKVLDISADLAGKEQLPVFYTKKELSGVKPSLREYRLSSLEELERFEGVGSAFYDRLCVFFPQLARHRDSILAIKGGHGTWVTDGKRVVIAPGESEKLIRKAIARLG